MTTYTINVKNNSSVQKTFFIFADQPTVSGGNTVFQNVFLSSPSAPGGSVGFSFQRTLYAVCGRQTLQKGAIVTQSFNSDPLTLGAPGRKGTSLQMVVNSGATSLLPETNNAEPGSYDVKTGTDFGQGENYFVGLGNKQSGSNEIKTVATIQVSPNAAYQITPHIKYYVATGTYQQGEIIDARGVGATKEIDFTGGAESATATYNNNGTWS